jgi:hypothetical protein
VQADVTLDAPTTPQADGDLGTGTARELADLGRSTVSRPLSVESETAAADLNELREPSWASVLATTARLWIERQKLGRRSTRRESDLARRVTGLALFLAGHQRADLHDAWRSDLLTQDGQFIRIHKQLRHVSGYLIAAIRYRLVNDLGGALSRQLDAVLISRGRTRTICVLLYAIPVAMVLRHEGTYGLVSNAEQLAIIAAGLATGVRGLRKWRGVQPPKKAETPD